MHYLFVSDVSSFTINRPGTCPVSILLQCRAYLKTKQDCKRKQSRERNMNRIMNHG